MVSSKLHRCKVTAATAAFACDIADLIMNNMQLLHMAIEQ